MDNIKVEVVYALPHKQYIHSITLTTGSTVEEAIHSSGILLSCKEIDLTNNKIGIFSKLAKLSDILQDGDRVEIYRPLINSPKELRRKRAESAIKNRKK